MAPKRKRTQADSLDDESLTPKRSSRRATREPGLGNASASPPTRSSGTRGTKAADIASEDGRPLKVTDEHVSGLGDLNPGQIIPSTEMNEVESGATEPKSETDANDGFGDEDDPAFLEALMTSADSTERTFGSSAPPSPARHPAAVSPAPQLPDILMVTRSVVLQMWAIAVCMREGYSRGTAISFAKVIATIMAKTRAKTLGLAERDAPQEEKYKKAMAMHQARQLAGGTVELYPAFGMEIVAAENRDGEVRGIIADEKSASTVDSKHAETFLKSQLGSRFDEVGDLMRRITEKHGREEIGQAAYGIYERLRPPFTGFGEKSPWNLDEVKRMASG